MNSTSLTFALSMAAIVGVTAWFIDWGAARKGHWGVKKRRVVRSLMIALTVITGVYVYWTDSILRGTTLFEVAGPWEENGGRRWTVEVEHPGVEHALMVYPFVRGLDSASRPVTLRVRFGQTAQTPLVEATTEHEVVSKSDPNATGGTWREADYDFTPTRIGPHDLLVESADGVLPPLLHLRITDPEKKNGKRAPGY